MPTPSRIDEPVSVTRAVGWLLGAVLVATVLRLWIFNGLYGHDDWMYLFYVRSHLNGENHDLLRDLWGLRWGVWVPVAVLFKLFGVSYGLAFLPGFLLGLASIPLAYAAAWQVTGRENAARWASVAMVLNPVDWFVSTTLRGDIEMSFYGGLLIWGLLVLDGRLNRSWLANAGIGLALGFIWGLAALTKEWAFVFGWGFCAVALYRMVSERRIPWRYSWILLGLALVLSADAWLLYELTGNVWQRFSCSLTFYDQIGREGGYARDLSLSVAYLPSVLLNLPNQFQEHQRFGNGYPLFGWYFYAFFAATLSAVWAWRRGPVLMQPVIVFVVGVLCWIQFGSMSLTTYLPFHKEPRYMTILSVPIAVIIGIAVARGWAGGHRRTRAALVGLAGALAVSTAVILRAEHVEYVSKRDMAPHLIQWMESHPQADVWVGSTLQQEVDLRLGYRFTDQVRNHPGLPEFGSIQDSEFLEEAKPGDYVFVTADDPAVLGVRYTPERWVAVASFPDGDQQAVMYRMPFPQLPPTRR